MAVKPNMAMFFSPWYARYSILLHILQSLSNGNFSSAIKRCSRKAYIFPSGGAARKPPLLAERGGGGRESICSCMHLSAQLNEEEGHLACAKALAWRCARMNVLLAHIYIYIVCHVVVYGLASPIDWKNVIWTTNTVRNTLHLFVVAVDRVKPSYDHDLSARVCLALSTMKKYWCW